MIRAFRHSLIIFMAVMLAVTPAIAGEGEFRPLPIDLSGGAPCNETFSYQKYVYEDPTIRVERTPESLHKELNLQYYAVDIRIKDPSQIRTAAADPNAFISERRIFAEVMANRVNAIFAMNGDYCGDYHGGESSKHVLRQGILFRSTTDTRLDMLLIDEDGNFHILPGGPELEKADKSQIDGKKIINVLQFGPGLVINGQPVEDEYILSDDHSPEFAKPAGKATRVCLLQIEPLHYKAICTKYTATLAQFKQLVLAVAPECTDAYVLDGGGSAQFVFLGKIINHLNAKGNQNLRRISDIIYFASAWFEKGK